MVPNIKIKKFYDSTYAYGPKEFESINLKNKIIKKILIIKWGGMGDVILSTGAMQDIYEAFPNSKIHLNTLPQWKSLFNDDPRFDKIWGTKKSQEIGFLKHLYKWINKIKYEKYDLIIDLQTNDRTRIYLTILKVIWQAPKFILGNHSVFPYSIFPKIVKNIERPLHLLQRTINTIGIESNNICPKLYITKEENKLALSILKNNKLAKENYDKDFTNYIANLQIDEEVELTQQEKFNKMMAFQEEQKNLTTYQKAGLESVQVFKYNNLPLEDKITKEIRDNNLNREFSFVQYKDLPFDDKFNISVHGSPVHVLFSLH